MISEKKETDLINEAKKIFGSLIYVHLLKPGEYKKCMHEECNKQPTVRIFVRFGSFDVYEYLVCENHAKEFGSKIIGISPLVPPRNSYKYPIV